MTEEIIIDITKCDFNTFDGGGSQRTICTLDNCFCDGIRNKDCYFKELKRLEFELKITKADYEASEQENKELKSALEEINRTLLGVRGLSINCDKQIIKVKAIVDKVLPKINEVL